MLPRLKIGMAARRPPVALMAFRVQGHENLVALKLIFFSSRPRRCWTRRT